MISMTRETSVPVWKITIYMDKKIYSSLNHPGTVQNAIKRVQKSLQNDKYVKGEKRVADEAKSIDIHIRYVGERYEQF